MSSAAPRIPRRECRPADSGALSSKTAASGDGASVERNLMTRLLLLLLVLASCHSLPDGARGWREGQFPNALGTKTQAGVASTPVILAPIPALAVGASTPLDACTTPPRQMVDTSGTPPATKHRVTAIRSQQGALTCAQHASASLKPGWQRQRRSQPSLAKPRVQVHCRWDFPRWSRKTCRCWRWLRVSQTCLQWPAHSRTGLEWL